MRLSQFAEFNDLHIQPKGVDFHVQTLREAADAMRTGDYKYEPKGEMQGPEEPEGQRMLRLQKEQAEKLRLIMGANIKSEDGVEEQKVA